MKKEWWYPTAFSLWGDEEAAAIARVVASGRFTQGEEVEAFESEFAAWHGKKHAIMVNSGSSANLLIVSALRHMGIIKPGESAIVPAIAWSTTYAPLIQHDIDLVLVDCDETWNAAPDNFRSDPGNISLIVGCSILGTPAYLIEWAGIASILDAILIEDNCESMGARVDSKFCGTFGFMASFSLFYSHQISAIEGGVVLTDSDEAAKVCRMLRAHGWTRDVERPRGFDKEYDFRVFGYNVRGLEMHAAIAREQLKRLPRFIEERQRNAAEFYALVHDIVDIPAHAQSGTSPFGLQFGVRDESRRPALVAALRAAGIDCRLPTGGSFVQHEYGRPWNGQRTPFADKVHRCGMFLGNAPFDLTVQIDRAAAIMREVLR